MHQRYNRQGGNLTQSRGFRRSKSNSETIVTVAILSRLTRDDMGSQENHDLHPDAPNW